MNAPPSPPPAAKAAPDPLLALLLALLLATPSTLAQPSSPEPPIQFEDQHADAPIRPLGTPGHIPVPIGVGCDAAETPGTQTSATIQPVNVPPGVDPLIVPNTTTWITQATDCSTNPLGTPHQATPQASLFLNNTVPAFDNVTVPLAMTVTKTPPETGQPTRTYGPYHANITAPVGYLGLIDITLQDASQTVGARDTATLNAHLKSLGNAETRTQFSAPEAPENVNVTTEPNPLTLAPGANKSFQIHVQLTDAPIGPYRDQFPITLTAHGVSTHDPTLPGARDEASFLISFENTIAGTPGPTVSLLTLSLLAAALLARRTRA